MPSDPLPLSPETGWDALNRELDDWDTNESPMLTAIVSRHRPRIEQEARTLERAEVIAEAVAAVEALEGVVYVDKDDVLAALSRLGERE
jgi:hypothetical protein